jgi:hypothetical protein
MNLTHNQIAETLNRLLPNGGWQVKGTEAFFESESDSLTDAEIEAAYNANAHKDKRAPEYPSLAEFADAYYWSQKGDDTKMTAYVAACDAVKTKYPKPEVE